MIKLIVGLGNPGQQYERTRHNAGFLFVDHLVGAQAARWSANTQFQGEIAGLDISGHKLVLLKPMTFMNRSGSSVGKVLRYYKFKPDELLVVHDELDLPEGSVKMKRDGGHAGHNGLRDIIAHIDTRDFFRLRLGIGRPSNGGNVADYVLSRPSSQVFTIWDGLFGRLEGEMNALISGDLAAINNSLAQ